MPSSISPDEVIDICDRLEQSLELYFYLLRSSIRYHGYSKEIKNSLRKLETAAEYGYRRYPEEFKLMGYDLIEFLYNYREYVLSKENHSAIRRAIFGIEVERNNETQCIPIKYLLSHPISLNLNIISAITCPSLEVSLIQPLVKAIREILIRAEILFEWKSLPIFMNIEHIHDWNMLIENTSNKKKLLNEILYDRRKYLADIDSVRRGAIRKRKVKRILDPTDKKIIKYLKKSYASEKHRKTRVIANDLGLNEKSIGKNLSKLRISSYIDNIRGKGYIITEKGRSLSL